MNQSSEYRYWGFISYSSKDVVTAIRFHRALEAFRIPRDLVGRISRDGAAIPKTLKPIFWEREELPLSAEVGPAVQEALRASRYLIVICSPDAARSRWVNEEIRYFCSLGRSDRVLPVIIRGEPNISDDPAEAEAECFPPTLRYRFGPDGTLTQERTNLYGWDLRNEGDGWQSCLLKAVGGMTGLGMTAFEKRGQARKARLRTLAAVGLTLLFALLFCCWDYTRVKTTYFAQLTERFGIPCGTVPIDRNTFAHRTASYRVESSRFKTRRIVRVNGSGWPVDPQEGDAGFGNAAIFRISYGKDGKADGVDLLSSQGKVQKRARYQPGQLPEASVIFTEFQVQDPSASEEPEKGWRKDSVQQVSYGPDGLPVRRMFLNAERTSQADANGSFGEAYTYNENKLVVQTVRLDPDAKPQPGRDGVMIIRQRRGLLGEVTRTTYYGQDERPLRGPGGWHQRDSALDPAGNRQEVHFLDVNGKLLPNPEGVAIIRYETDRQGNVRESSFFAANGQPVLNAHQIAREAVSFDPLGRVTGRAYFGLRGEPTQCSHGVCRYVDELDAKGNTLKRTYTDQQGRPLLTADGISECTPDGGRDRDLSSLAGENPAVSNLANAGQLALSTDAVKPKETPLPEAPPAQPAPPEAPPQKPVEPATQPPPDAVVASAPALMAVEPAKPKETPLPEAPPVQPAPPEAPPQKEVESPKPILKPIDRATAIQTSFSVLNDITLLERSREVGATAKVDGNGNRRLFLGLHDEPILEFEGVAKCASKFDETGRLIEIAFLGPDGHRVLHRDGYSGWTSKFDERGNETVRAFLGLDDQLALHKDGYAGWTAQFDPQGNEIERRYLGVDGQSVADANGVTRWTREYEDRREIKRAFFDSKGKPVANREGIAGWTSKLDDQDRLIEVSCFGMNGEPSLHRNGFAKWTATYDADGNQTRKAFCDLTGQPLACRDGYAAWTAKFNADGDEIERSFLGTDGKPTRTKEGIAKSASKFDDDDNEIERSYFGLDGKPTLHKKGYRGWRAKFDERGNEIERAFFGFEKMPVLVTGRYAGWTAEFDPRGYEIKRSFFGTDGRPLMIAEGIAGWVSRIDERGNVVEASCFGLRGQPALHSDGYAKWTAKFDARGNEIERSYFGLDGQPVLHRFGMHRRVAVFDVRGNEIESARFGRESEPVVNTNHYHRVRSRYNQHGLRTEQAWFGEEDKPVINTDPELSAARVAWTYTPRGDVAEKARFGLDGKPINGSDGWARELRNYDPDTGKLLNVKRFKADGTALQEE